MISDIETGEIVEALYSRSAQLNELFAALASAQAEFESAKKAGTNPHFKSKYPTLESVLEATAEGRKNNKLALIQMPGNVGGSNIAVTTILGHASGQWIESRFHVAPVKFDAQGAGAVVTYLRRYAALSILGIAPEDDDGNAAVRQPNATSAAPPPSRTPSATGNGQHPRSLSEIRDAIWHALEMADSPSRIDGILRVHEKGLEEIRVASQPTYDRLMRIAGERRGQLVEPPRPDAGMVSELLGEP